MSSDFIYDHPYFRKPIKSKERCSACNKPKQDKRKKWCDACHEKYRQEMVGFPGAGLGKAAGAKRGSPSGRGASRT